MHGVTLPGMALELPREGLALPGVAVEFLSIARLWLRLLLRLRRRLRLRLRLQLRFGLGSDLRNLAGAKTGQAGKAHARLQYTDSRKVGRHWKRPIRKLK